MTKIKLDAEILITGNGEIIKNGSVVFEGTKILYAGDSESSISFDEYKQVPIAMPGLWECHGHFFGIKNANSEASNIIKPEIACLRSVWDVQSALHMGITSIREVGGYGVYLKQVIQEGHFLGPRIYGAGSILSMTGGHGDLHSLPLDLLQHSSIPFRLVDGTAECYKGVREQIRKGAEIIKYCASGGNMSVTDEPIYQQLSFEEQKAIVDEASRSNIAVAAHCHGELGIKSALDAGVKTIEHGSYLTEELADLMIEKEGILVPTRLIVDKDFPDNSVWSIPEYANEKRKKLAKRHLEALKIAIKKGVKIAMGTDLGISGPNPDWCWGANAMELEYYIKAGMKPMDAIVTATGNGPLTLGNRAPKSGQLKEGYDADILLLKENPLEDITGLQRPENILHVIKQGKFVK